MSIVSTRPGIVVRFPVKFPARVFGDAPIVVEQDGANFTFSFDIDALLPLLPDEGLFVLGVPSGGDDTATIQAKLDAAGVRGGGRVLLGPYSYLIGTLTVPHHVYLEGSGLAEDVVQTPFNYQSGRKFALYSTATGTTPAVQLNGGLRNITILQDRIRTLPIPGGASIAATRAGFQAYIDGFTGIGVKIGDGSNPGPANNTDMNNVIIGGFGTQIQTRFSAQDRKTHIFMDGTNGYDCQDSHDNDKNNNIESWPFLTGLRAGVEQTWAVASFADNGAGLIRVTTASQDLVAGEKIFIKSGIGGEGMKGRWVVAATGLTSTTVDLTGSEITPVRTGATVTGATLVTALSGAGTANLRKGMTVAGVGIQAGTTIAMVLKSQAAIHLSLPATATGSPTLTFDSTAYTPSSSTAAWSGNYRSGRGFFVHDTEGFQGNELFAFSCEEPFVFDNMLNGNVVGGVADGIINRTRNHAIQLTGNSGGNNFEFCSLAGSRGIYVNQTNANTSMITANLVAGDAILEAVGTHNLIANISSALPGHIHTETNVRLSLSGSIMGGAKVYTAGTGAAGFFGLPFLSTADNSYYGSGRFNGMRINHPNEAGILLYNDGAPVDEKKWKLLTQTSGDLLIDGFSDDEGTALEFLRLLRPSGIASGSIKLSRPLTMAGTAPTGAATGAGTSPVVTFGAGSNDNVGTIVLTTGTAPMAALGTLTLTLGQAFTGNNPNFLMSPYDTGAGIWDARATIRMSVQSQSAPVFKWDNNGVDLAASTAYHIGYIALGK